METKYQIIGGKELSGEIAVNGAKNFALKVIPATILLSGTASISNLPIIEDIKRELTILEKLGATVQGSGHEIAISTDGITKTDLDVESAQRIRASISFVAPLLTRYGRVSFPHPGGDVIGAGSRPIDIFIEGFEKMGATVSLKNNVYTITAKKLAGMTYFFPIVSVTATEALIMAAVLAQGNTVLKNCAMEPEVTALADYLNTCGARISGAGTPVIAIEGVAELHAQPVTIIPDRLETGTFAILAAATKSRITITNCNPGHIEALLALFDRIGVPYEAGTDTLMIKKATRLIAHDLKTHEYPGYATDLQAPYTVLMTQAEGSSLIHETIYDRRLLYTDLLLQMGAEIILCDPHRVVIHGPTKLHGRTVISPDVRAGMAMVIAGLIAEGTTTIGNVYQINRGYENIVQRLTGIGAAITEITE